MTIQTNTTDRKALAHALAEALRTSAHYEGMPTGNYTVGDYTIDREGNIHGDDFTAIHDFLLENGYLPEMEILTSEAPSDASTPDGAPTSEAATDENSADGAPASESPTETVRDIRRPAGDFTVEQLRNLTNMLYSHQHILNLMTGGDSIRIPKKLTDALKQALPETPEAFTALLEAHQATGLKGFAYCDGEVNMAFPYSESEPRKWEAFGRLVERILEAARRATRVEVFCKEPEEQAQKYFGNAWLVRLGYGGAAMKEDRNILLKPLHGYAAFRNSEKMQVHKDRLKAIRAEQRAARMEAVVSE